MTNTAPDLADRTAVVVGLGSIVGLQTARLLRRRGMRVVGVTGDRAHFAARTRAAARVVEADVNGPGLLAALVALGVQEPGALLVPCTDHAVALVAENAAVLSAFRIPLPDAAVVRTLADKASFAEHALAHGLPVPPTAVVRSVADLDAAARTLAFPVVLKPAFKDPRWKRGTHVKVLRLSTAEQLLAVGTPLLAHSDALVVQSFVPGGDEQLLTCNAYFAGGSALVTFVTRKVRQWPAHVGIASYAVEARDDEMVELTTRLFGSLPYRGLAYLEAKRDPTTGRLVMIEANVGRPTGRSATAEHGGVELLATMAADTLGLPLPERREQHYRGTAWLDLRRDVLAGLLAVRGGRLRPTTWLRQAVRARAHAVLSARDPLPFLLEIGQSAGKALRRRLPRRVSRAS